MDKNQKLFVYDRREMSLLLGLILGVSLIAFTLGVHLGKRIGSHSAPREIGDAPTVATSPDQIPNRQELTEQSKATEQAAEESLNQALHDEVARTGIKLETPRQVQLPRQAKTAKAGATTLPANGASTDEKRAEALAKVHAESKSATQEKHRAADEGSSHSQGATEGTAAHRGYSLQIGSYPSQAEATHLIEKLEHNQLKGYAVSADLQGKGTWYRVYVGEFPDRDQAEKAGVEYRSKQWIESFIVSRAPSRRVSKVMRNEESTPKNQEASSHGEGH